MWRENHGFVHFLVKNSKLYLEYNTRFFSLTCSRLKCNDCISAFGKKRLYLSRSEPRPLFHYNYVALWDIGESRQGENAFQMQM